MVSFRGWVAKKISVYAGAALRRPSQVVALKSNARGVRKTAPPAAQAFTVRCIEKATR